MTPAQEAHALTAHQLANYKGHNDTQVMGPGTLYDKVFLGFIGEIMFGRCFGYTRDHLRHIGSDGGIDYEFKINGQHYSVNVKTAGSDYGLMVKPHRWLADYFVLIHYINKQAKFIGWARGSDVKRAPMLNRGHGDQHHIPSNELQPMATFCDLMALRDEA